jgi:hypothetical protein
MRESGTAESWKRRNVAHPLNIQPLQANRPKATGDSGGESHCCWKAMLEAIHVNCEEGAGISWRSGMSRQQARSHQGSAADAHPPISCQRENDGGAHTRTATIVRTTTSIVEALRAWRDGEEDEFAPQASGLRPQASILSPEDPRPEA